MGKSLKGANWLPLMIVVLRAQQELAEEVRDFENFRLDYNQSVADLTDMAALESLGTSPHLNN